MLHEVLERRRQRRQASGGLVARQPNVRDARAGRGRARGVQTFRGLSRDALDRHVVAKPEIHGRAHLLVSCPLRKLHLGHELGTNPVRPLVRRWARAERTRRRLERLHPTRQARQLRVREPGARMTDVFETTILPHAEQQRAEEPARAAGLGIAADHAVLPADELQLGPRGIPASARIRCVEPFRDQALPAPRERLAMECAAVSGYEGAEPERLRAGVAVDALEPGATRGERQPAQVLAGIAQHVEDDQRDALLARRGDVARPRKMHSPLKILKAGRLATLVERDDLTVEQHRRFQAPRERNQCVDDVRELRGLVVPEA